MRIGLVTDFYYPWIAGPSILLRNLGHGLAARGHSVFLLAPSPIGPPAEEEDGPIVVTRARTVSSPFGHDLRVALPLAADAPKWMDRVAPDVVHIHHPFPLSARALFAARRRGIPVAATNHTIPQCTLWGIRSLGPGYSFAHAAFARWLLFLLRRCDRVATPTITAAQALRELGYEPDVEVISNGVDSQRFVPGRPNRSMGQRFGLTPELPVVLYTGRLDGEKDMDTWLDAATLTLRRCQAQFVVGGKGADRPRLERRVRELDIAGSVRFIGYVSDEELGDLYRLADVYCVTSPVELQSIATLEALASGLPVVGVRAGALPEIVRDGVNGYCVPPGDARAVSEALVLALASEENRHRLGEGSRRIALNHDLNQSVDAYERFLQSTAALRRGEPRRERAAAIGS